MEKSKTKKYEGQEVFVGVDVHKRTYSVCCILGEREYKSQSVPADPQKLINHLLKKFPGATYSLAYEAGFCGFRLYDELTECGMTCLVVHAADVVTTDKEKRRKTDPSDSRKLARALRGGLLSGIRVPNGEDRALQSLTRHREQLVKDQVRIQNQIKSHLDYHGVDIPVDYQGNKWSKRFVEWLSTSTGMTGYLAYVLNSHLVRYKAIMAWIEEVNKEMKKASKSEEYVDDIGYLKSVPGISVTNALIFRAEVGSIEHYSSQDRLASFAGLTLGSRSCGD